MQLQTLVLDLASNSVLNLASIVTPTLSRKSVLNQEAQGADIWAIQRNFLLKDLGGNLGGIWGGNLGGNLRDNLGDDLNARFKIDFATARFTHSEIFLGGCWIFGGVCETSSYVFCSFCNAGVWMTWQNSSNSNACSSSFCCKLHNNFM